MAPEAGNPPKPDGEGEIWTTYRKSERILIVFLAAMAGIVSPLSSQIYFPALNSVAEDLHVSLAQVNLTLTTFLIFQGVSPMFVSDLADNLGRRPTYIAAFIIYFFANIGLALQSNYAALLVLRCVQSAGSSGTIALAYAMVADISTAAQRGTYMGFTGAGIILGPCLGPIIGGVLAQYLGWHSVFWALSIFSGVVLIVLLFFLPETGRNIVGNGSIPPPRYSWSFVSESQHRRKIRGLDAEACAVVINEGNRQRDELARTRKVGIPNPFTTLKVLAEKDIALLLFVNSLGYTAFYCAIASLPQVFAAKYGFDDIVIGLCFIPLGFGGAVASVLNGRAMDYNYRRLAKQNGISVEKRRVGNLRKFPVEKARLQLCIPLILSGTFFYLAYGWLIDYTVHPAAPLIMLLFVGFCINGAFSIGNTLLIDLYPRSPAIVTSANNLVRCFMAAGGTALINPMIAAMGLGWCFTFIALVMLLGTPLYYLLQRKGPKWREARYARWEREDASKNKAPSPAVVQSEQEQERSPQPIETDLEKGK